jgi:heme/copper-type cytochrome/quinol oxidase subunit 1
MSTIDTSPELITAPADRREETATRGGAAGSALAALVTSADHKVVGRLFVGASLLAMLAITVLNALLGAERIDGGGTLLDEGAIVQLFFAQRVGMLFGVLVPLLLGIAIAIVPLQLGARALAFPRLAMAGFWTWLAGLVIVIVALAGNGGPGGGDADMVDLFLAAHALLLIGLAAAAVSVATSVLTTRAPGMRLGRVPFFSWGALVAAVGLLLLVPVIVGTLVYLFVDHRHGRVIFGGNDGVAVWLRFAWTQPATYLYALPAVGLLAELVPVTFQRRAVLRGATYAGVALVGVAALAGIAQRTFLVAWDGSAGDKLEDVVLWAMFLLLPVLGTVVVFATTLVNGYPVPGGPRPRVGPPFAFAVLGVGLLLAGMLAGALTNLTGLDLVGTVFEEGAMIYVVYGGALAAMGAVAYWMPKWSGHRLPSGASFGLALLGALATVLAALPLLIAGFADQPALAATYDYSGPSELWNTLSTVGHGLMALVALGFVGLALGAAAGRGEAVTADPWGGQTLEWTTTSPAPAANFADQPTVMSPEPGLDLRAAPSRTQESAA